MPTLTIAAVSSLSSSLLGIHRTLASPAMGHWGTGARAPHRLPTSFVIGVGAQSIWGQDILPENICMKKLAKCPKFTWYLTKKCFPSFFFFLGGGPLTLGLLRLWILCATTLRPLFSLQTEICSGASEDTPGDAQLIPGKIIKIVATRCHILRLKCTKFNFGWRPRWGSSQRCPRPP